MCAQVVDIVRLQLLAILDGSSGAIMAGNSWVAESNAHVNGKVHYNIKIHIPYNKIARLWILH